MSTPVAVSIRHEWNTIVNRLNPLAPLGSPSSDKPAAPVTTFDAGMVGFILGALATIVIGWVAIWYLAGALRLDIESLKANLRQAWKSHHASVLGRGRVPNAISPAPRRAK